MKIEKITFNQNRDHSPLKKNLVLILGLDWRPFQKKRIPGSRINQYQSVSRSILQRIEKFVRASEQIIENESFFLKI